MNITDSSGYFEKVREMAKAAGTTVTALCRRAGVNRTTVDGWRVGKATPTFRTWGKLEVAAQSMKAELEARQ